MAIQIVIDHTGDTRFHFGAGIETRSEAVARFDKLAGLGFTAAVRSASGKVAIWHRS